MEGDNLTSSRSPSKHPEDEQEPEQKKHKTALNVELGFVSTVSSDDEHSNPSVANTNPVPKQRYKRRKVAIVFAYCGVGYQGMQKNPGAKTIEGELEEALYRCGAVPEHDRGKPQRYDWARSARTDKGVSAVGQVVSGRFYVDPPGFVERLNAQLPEQIRIFGYKRVTSSFNAKKFCDRRRYVYLIPVFSLDPCSHRDRESVLASLGTGNELVKCIECSERGRKVIGVMGRRGPREFMSCTRDASGKQECPEFLLGNGDLVAMVNDNPGVDEHIAAPETHEVEEESVNENVSAEICETENSNGNHKNGAPIEAEVCAESLLPNEKEDGYSSGAGVSKETDSNTVIDGEKCQDNGEGGNWTKKASESGFRYRTEERERFNRILRYYVGSHNFHNFTTRTKAEDPAAQRYIISFEAQTSVTIDGVEFVKCEVVGQSFMLHQIRKMIGLAVAVMRNCAPESLLETALRKDISVNIPTAPEVGLYLDECLFYSYNEKWKDSHEELSMKAYQDAAEEFKMKYIYSHIAAMEHKEGVVGLWLHSLNSRNYPDLHFATREGNCSASTVPL